MPPDPDYVSYVLEQLEGAGDITSKAMFGGLGIWESGDIFAFISSDSELYFKVDDSTRPAYEEAGCHHFRSMPYWSVPADALDDRAMFQQFVAEAVAAGHRTAGKR